jgi:hypothetical protein
MAKAEHLPSTTWRPPSAERRLDQIDVGAINRFRASLLEEELMREGCAVLDHVALGRAKHEENVIKRLLSACAEVRG